MPEDRRLIDVAIVLWLIGARFLRSCSKRQCSVISYFAMRRQCAFLSSGSNWSRSLAIAPRARRRLCRCDLSLPYSRGKSRWLPEQAPDEIDPLPLDHLGAREAGL